MMNLYDEWKNLTLSQFWGKKVLGGIIRAMAEVLEKVYTEQQDLRNLLNIDKMEGVNLDNIGDIVCMSRYDAHQILRRSEEFEMDDVLYRRILKYKILLNNASATYYDIMDGISLTWDASDVVYREDPQLPATYILDMKSHDIDSNDILESRTMTIKAGGVKALFLITWIMVIQYDFWSMMHARVTYQILIPFFNENVRKWDGSWKLDGSFLLDAEIQKPAKVTYTGEKLNWSNTIRLNGAPEIPDRLMITTNGEIRVTSEEAAIIGSRGYDLSVIAEEDNLAVISTNTPDVFDAEAGLLVAGEKEHTVNADDYLVSQEELYGEFKDDGLMINYMCEAQFDLEVAAIWQR